MEELINNIVKAVETSQDFVSTLSNSNIRCKQNYPIAILHTIHRAKTPEIKEQFQNLTDKNGMTPEVYTDEEFADIYSNTPEALQCVDFLALKHEPKSKVHYKSKYENDFWKKIQDVEHIQTSFDFMNFDKNDNEAMVEFRLRELIRKRKEVHALKEVGFIWMAITKKDASKVFKHYFDENYLVIDGQYHIGWKDKLKDISMRHFVYPPNTHI